jgi:hypothetical protein
MTPEQFAYWLNGFAELSPMPPSQEQWQSIREHLATVFKKVTPPVAGPVMTTPVKGTDWEEIFSKGISPFGPVICRGDS